MLPVQSSLAESVDGEDVRSDDGGDERGERPVGDYYCLYLYHHAGSVSGQGVGDDDDDDGGSFAADVSCGADFSLSLVDTNLAAEAEPELRNFIAKRLSRGAMFEGMGNVASVDLGSPEYTLGCYFCLIQGKLEVRTEPGPPTPQHIICFLGGTEKGLDLYPSYVPAGIYI
ncbi:protein Njmu-R1 [Rhinoderma darwinii]|uniref:protein Njmu-R1 n=1 Tax=Rhinoderma darwinii TaxID=43563 RepID=UPI003F675CBD